MLRVAHIYSIDAPVKEKRLTKKESEYLDSLNWVNQQSALDLKEANKYLEQALKALETEKPSIVVEG